MRILYAIQGTGNGHLSRATDIIPILQKRGDVDILVSGCQAEVSLPFPVKYTCKGLGFTFGKKGGIDLTQTFLDADIKELIQCIRDFPIQDYDLVINDFEPITAWASLFKNKTCISLSHQTAVISQNSPKPKNKDLVGRLVLKHYAPTSINYGFHFAKFDDNITTPVIRQQVRDLNPKNLGHYTVYLPAYSEKALLKQLLKFKDVKWEVFSKRNKKAFRQGNLHFQPIENKSFLKSLETCEGVLCGAGFETPAEALFLQKKLIVIPMKGQYEQQCNAAALAYLGVPVMKKLKGDHLVKLQDWLQNGKVVPVDYPDVTENFIDGIFEKHLENQQSPVFAENRYQKSMRNIFTRFA